MKTVTRLGALAAGAVLSATALVASGGAASASTADCASWTNPGSATSVKNVYTKTVNSRITVALRSGTVNGKQYGWARLTGSTQVGDKVWMDVSFDGGSSWTQCGPYSVDADGSIPYTRAYAVSQTNNNLRFRACGRPNGVLVSSVCGPWW